MAKRKRQTTQAVIEKRLKEGRGQGTGVTYKPWLTIQDVSSNGICKRIKGLTTERRHEFLSRLEVHYFYILDWSPVVEDIREQYPLLPLSETLEVAEQLGIRHPTDSKTQEPIVMTTDFYIAIRQDMGVSYQARTVKPSGELENERTIEKFEIERQYWLKRNISWGIVTEREIPPILGENIDWISGRFDEENLSLSERELLQAKKLLLQWIAQRDDPLTEITADCDDKLGLEPGDSLSVVRHMLARRELLVDLNQPINPRKKLVLLKSLSVDLINQREKLDEPFCQPATLLA
jgi:hypothetical protein